MPHLIAFLVLLTAIGVSADDSGLRFLTFRDSSIIRVDLSSAPAFNWDPSAPAIAATDITQVRFSVEPAGKRIRTIKELLARLTSVDFAARESASSQLSMIAPGFTELLNEFKNASDDPEIRYRITTILSKMPPRSAAESNFDSLVTRAGDRLTGDVGAWSATVDYRGHRLALSRENVAEISVDPPALLSASPTRPPADPAAAATAANPTVPDAAFAEIREDENALFPPDVIRTEFESDPGGRPLKPGEDISSRFAEAGFQIRTSVEGGIVSVNDFVVNGRSKGLSAATHLPLWTGTLTIDFHLPGNPSVPASVHAAGFWVASVSPGGTALEAYGEEGEKIGTVTTKNSGHEFLAFSSAIPISQIRIVPNVPVDPNYTIDDLFFTRPIARGIRAEVGWGVAHTAEGERFLARRFTPSADSFALAGLSIGIPTLDLAPAAVVAFAPPPSEKPPEPEPDADPEDIHWIMLKSGSRLRATRAGFPEHRWVTLPDTPIPPDQIAALWGIKESPVPPPLTQQTFLRGGDRAATPSPSNPELWLSIEGPLLGETRLETPGLADLPELPKYHSTKVIWFDFFVLVPPKSHGILILSSGERITLSPATTSVDSISSSGITLNLAGQKISLPLEKITSCQLPTR